MTGRQSVFAAVATGLLAINCGAASATAPLRASPLASPPPLEVLLPSLLTTVTAAHVAVLVRSDGADALADRLIRDLPTAWQQATRGLGTLVIVEEDKRSSASLHYDIELDAVAGTAVSFHNRRDPRFATRIQVFEHSPAGYGNASPVAIAVHEIGHFWCCYGAGTAEGHWTDDAQIGVMNSSGRGLEAMRFSDRELQLMGLVPKP